MNSLGTAIKIAAEVHEGQKDLAGEDYIFHSLAVMDALVPYGEESMIIGVLHDVLEDFPGTYTQRDEFEADLRRHFTGGVVNAIKALSRDPGEDYSAYIDRLTKESDTVKRVKVADLSHNLDPRRIPISEATESTYRRWEKYRKAILKLS